MFMRLIQSGCPWLVAAYLAAAGFAAGAAEPAPLPATSEQIDALIAQLGSDRFSTREAASDKLAQIGLPAFHALEAASRHSDREIRFRAERILTLIRKNDLERRLAAFASRAGANEDEDLPAWSRFKKTYGDSEPTRQLFIDMQRAEPELLAAFDRDPRAAVELLGARLQERLFAQQQGMRPAQLAGAPAATCTHLFIAGEEDAPVSSTSMMQLLSQCRQGEFSNFVTTNKGDLAKKMLGRTILRCEGRSAATAFQVAMTYELKEGLTLALKVLEETTAPANQSGQMQALQFIARLGDESHLPAVEKYFDNAAVVQSFRINNVNREMQLRDVALATAVILTKQNLNDYFTPAQGVNTRIATSQAFSPLLTSFENNEQRDAAMKKWAEFKAKRKPAAAVPPAGAPKNDAPTAPPPDRKSP